MTEFKKVVIPPELIKALKPVGLERFVKIEKPILDDTSSGKKAFEHGWAEKFYSPDDPELQQWLDAGNNYGVAAGDGLIIVDTDTKEAYESLVKGMPTFAVATGRKDGEGRHAYYKGHLEENGSLNTGKGKEKKNFGNIQVYRKFVVGPGSNHNSGGIYKIFKNLPLAKIDKRNFEEAYGAALKWTGESQKLAEDEVQEERKQLADANIPIQDLIEKFDELRKTSGDEYQGAHPIHGSTTGQNFCVNTSKNAWYCFRCNSGGGPLLWLAVQEGLIPCDEAKAGALRGEIFQKVVKLAEAKGFKVNISRSELEPDVSRYFEINEKNGKSTFRAAFLAADLMEKYHYITRDEDKIIFLYHLNLGIYTASGEAHLMREVALALGKYLTKNRLLEVINDVTCRTIRELSTIPPNLIALKNGVFNLKTKELLPFSPDYFILNKIPVAHNKAAMCPNIKKFACDILNPEDVQSIPELFGYCLWQDYQIHKAFLFLGGGANGKGTLLDIFSAFLGEANVEAIPLQDLEHLFARSALFGKLANICADLQNKKLETTGQFKMLASHDLVSAAKKFHDQFKFRSIAKLLFSCNEIPKTNDDTTAFFRRWNILNCPNQFKDENPKTDKNIIKKLTTDEELSGMFNWALEGLDRLLKNGQFTGTKSEEETRRQWITSSNPVKGFAETYLEVAIGSKIKKDTLFATFLEFCKKERVQTISKRSFSEQLGAHISPLESEYIIEQGVNIGYWKDLKIKAEMQEKLHADAVKSQDPSKKEKAKGSEPFSKFMEKEEK